MCHQRWIKLPGMEMMSLGVVDRHLDYSCVGQQFHNCIHHVQLTEVHPSRAIDSTNGTAKCSLGGLRGEFQRAMMLSPDKLRNCHKYHDLSSAVVLYS